jgi:hypothetical protein
MPQKVLCMQLNKRERGKKHDLNAAQIAKTTA